MTPNSNPSSELREVIARICFVPDRQSLHGWDSARAMAEQTPRSCTGACVRAAYERADAVLALSQTLPAPGEVEDPDHQYAVVSADYRRPFLAGAYATLEAALLAQDGKPDRWHIYHRLAATVAAANDEGVAEAFQPFILSIGDHVPDDKVMTAFAHTAGDYRRLAAAIRLLSQGGGKA